MTCKRSVANVATGNQMTQAPLISFLTYFWPIFSHGRHYGNVCSIVRLADLQKNVKFYLPNTVICIAAEANNDAKFVMLCVGTFYFLLLHFTTLVRKLFNMPLLKNQSL
jgi:hypothetical protein